LEDEVPYEVKVEHSIYSFIQHLLMEDEQKITVEKIFNIMDRSGDGQLETDELKEGYNSVFSNETIDNMIQKINE